MLILLIKYISKYYERIGTEVAEIELTFSFPESWAIVMLHSISALIDGEKRTGNYICLDAKYLRGKSYGEQMNAGRFIHSGDNIILVDGVSFPKRVDSQILVTLSGWVCSSHLQTSSGVECFATLRVPFPFPLAAGRCKAL